MESSQARPITSRTRAPSGQGRNNLAESDMLNPRAQTAVLSSTSRFPLHGTVSVASRQSGNYRPDYSSFSVRKSVSKHDFGVSRHATIPSDDPPPMRTKTLQCPETWIRKNMQPSWLEDSQQQPILPAEEKVRVARKFIERNKDRLWKFNTAYLHRSPREIADELVADRGFVPVMQHYVSKEKTFKVKLSEGMQRCMRDPLKEAHPQRFDDPFIMTMGSARDQRMERRMRTLAPQAASLDKFRFRGYRHIPEIGNFSKYNSMLKTNKDAILQR